MSSFLSCFILPASVQGDFPLKTLRVEIIPSSCIYWALAPCPARWGTQGLEAASESRWCICVHPPWLPEGSKAGADQLPGPCLWSFPPLRIPAANTPTVFRIQSRLHFYQNIFPRCSFCLLGKKKKKKNTTWELWVTVYLRQSEDCSPGDSPSDSSEKLLLKGRGRSV